MQYAHLFTLLYCLYVYVCMEVYTSSFLNLLDEIDLMQPSGGRG